MFKQIRFIVYLLIIYKSFEKINVFIVIKFSMNFDMYPRILPIALSLCLKIWPKVLKLLGGVCILCIPYKSS
jgi:hypothetical protein